MIQAVAHGDPDHHSKGITRFAERLAVEAEAGLVDDEEQGLERSKPFHQRGEVRKAKNICRQPADVRFPHLILDSSKPGLVLEILGQEPTDTPEHGAFRLVSEGPKGGLGWRAKRGGGQHRIW
jgi:hypothetical protein